MAARSTLEDGMLEVAARRFRALGEMQRLRILQVLEHGERSVGTIVAESRGSQSNISRHLQALHDAGLVRRRREGNSVVYGIAYPMVLELCSLVCMDTRKHAARILSSFGDGPRNGAKAEQ